MSGRQLAEAWLGDTIANLGFDVYRQPAPQGTPYPHVTISLRGGMDIRPVNAPATAERLTYDISAWNEGTDASGLGPISDAIRAVLDGTPPVEVNGGLILGCRRIGVVPIDSIVENGEHFVRDGYVYEVITLTS
jgi:hypothetical protein